MPVVNLYNKPDLLPLGWGYQSHHVATNGPLSDLKPQGSFQVSQSSTVSGQLIAYLW